MNTHKAIVESDTHAITLIAAGDRMFCEEALSEWLDDVPLKTGETAYVVESVMQVRPKGGPAEAEVERIARLWFEQPCPPEDGGSCTLSMHDWENGHPDDKEYALETVRFVLREATKHNM